MRFRLWLPVILFTFACVSAPQIPGNRYGLQVVPDAATYAALTRHDASMRLVDVEAAVPGVRIDVRYATADNFMKRPLYPVAKVYLRVPVARALAAVQKELALTGLGLKVFDGYRPYRITEMMWEPIRNPDYVADPAKGSRHNRGAAVDLTLVRRDTGEELAMPTPYDDFTEKAHHDFMGLDAGVLANRELLKKVMERHGFEALRSEWWHYDFAGWRNFPLMDVALEQLAAGAR